MITKEATHFSQLVICYCKMISGIIRGHIRQILDQFSNAPRALVQKCLLRRFHQESEQITECTEITQRRLYSPCTKILLLWAICFYGFFGQWWCFRGKECRMAEINLPTALSIDS